LASIANQTVVVSGDCSNIMAAEKFNDLVGLVPITHNIATTEYLIDSHGFDLLITEFNSPQVGMGVGNNCRSVSQCICILDHFEPVYFRMVLGIKSLATG